MLSVIPWRLLTSVEKLDAEEKVGSETGNGFSTLAILSLELNFFTILEQMSFVTGRIKHEVFISRCESGSERSKGGLFFKLLFKRVV